MTDQPHDDTISEAPSAAIQALNDQLRTTGQGGRVMLTAGLLGRGKAQVALALAAVAAFTAFDADNDPYGEHDAALLEAGGDTIMFKIDYYDRSLTSHSPNPADPAVTERVMTLMLAEEY